MEKIIGSAFIIMCFSWICYLLGRFDQKNNDYLGAIIPVLVTIACSFIILLLSFAP